MSLNSDFSKCKNPDSVWDEKDQMRPIPNAIVYLTMLIDMGEITEKNAPEFYDRVAMYEKILGPLLHMATDDGMVDLPITADNIRGLIGLSTNVSTKSRKHFLSRLGRMAIDHAVGRRVSDYAVTTFPVSTAATGLSLAPPC
jgi:hypothetical protein